MFSEFDQRETWAARDSEGVWHYRDADPEGSSEPLRFRMFLGSPDGELFSFAGCVIEYGDESFHLNHACRDCGLRYGYSEDDTCDDFDEPLEEFA